MAGFLDPAVLEQIRGANDIVEVIGSSLPLKRAGANFVTLCPFHREKSPSFSVNPHKQIFYCFGCHKGGDVFSFIKEYENLSFFEAVKRLAERAGIPLQFDKSPGYQQAQHLKDTLWQIHEQIAQRWQSALLNEASGQIARDYLIKRGVSEEAITLFRLGYAPDVWDDTVNWSKGKGFALGMVEQAGLILHKEESDHYYDRFRGRLMFPICDEQGRVVAFSGRILSGDEKMAKYVNSPETPIFSKGRVFYGLDKSKRAILDAGFAIVCEGQLDLIACFMGGVRNIVAPQGTAFTSEHARILKRYVNEVVLCFDSDNAGQNAMSRALDSLLAAGLAVKVTSVPDPHDPDSFIREFGGPAFAELINKSEGYFDFYLKRLCAMHNPATDLGRMTIVRAMGEAVLKTGSAVLIDTYSQKTAQRLGVKAGSVREEFNKRSRGKTAPVDVESNAVAANPPVTLPPKREFWLLQFVLASDEHVALAATTLDFNWLKHDGIRKILAARFSAESEGTWRGIPALMDQFEDQGLKNLIAQAVAAKILNKNLEIQIAENIRMLRNDAIDQELAALTNRFNDPNLSESEKIEIKRRKEELMRLNSDRFFRRSEKDPI